MPFFFDTETTGKWNFKSDYKDPKQPALVQVAGILDDGYEDILGEFNFLVRVPDDKEIEPGAAAVHGITRAKAERGAVGLITVLNLFESYLVHAGGLIVGHNIPFDVKVMQRYFYTGDPDMGEYPEMSDGLAQCDMRCTMRQATPVCKLPGKYGYKWPTLTEAYCSLVDPAGFEGAHDAMADVRASREIYYKLDWFIKHQEGKY